MAAAAFTEHHVSLTFLHQGVLVCVKVTVLSAGQIIFAGSDEAPDDINKLKTKVRRLYDIANVLTSLNLITKVHLKPTRKPGFQWLGIDGICLHSEQQSMQTEAAETDLPTSLTAITAQGLSEDPSSTATGSSMHQHPLPHHTSSCNQPLNNLTHDDTLSPSSRQRKRSAAALEPPSSQKRSRTTRSLPSPTVAAHSSQATVMQSVCPLQEAGQHEQHGQEVNKVSSSPAMDEEHDAAEGCQPGNRPTPVPITPEGGQPDTPQLQRHQVWI